MAIMNVTRSTIEGKAFMLRVPADFLTMFVMPTIMSINDKYFTCGKAVQKQKIGISPERDQKTPFVVMELHPSFNKPHIKESIKYGIIQTKQFNRKLYKQTGFFAIFWKYENSNVYILGKGAKHISQNFTSIVY